MFHIVCVYYSVFKKLIIMVKIQYSALVHNSSVNTTLCFSFILKP